MHLPRTSTPEQLLKRIPIGTIIPTPPGAHRRGTKPQPDAFMLWPLDRYHHERPNNQYMRDVYRYQPNIQVFGLEMGESEPSRTTPARLVPVVLLATLLQDMPLADAVSRAWNSPQALSVSVAVTVP